MCETLNMRHCKAAAMANLERGFDATWTKDLIDKLYKAGMLRTILDSFLTNRFLATLVNV